MQGFPSFLSGHWDPMMAALCDEGMVLSLHIGAGFEVIRRPQEAPIDHLMVLACQISAITAQDLLFGPTLRQFPDLKVALSEGGIGWIPFYFDRIDRHFQNQSWLHDGDDFGGKLPSEVFRDHILACYITDPSGLALRDRIGIDIIAWECDYPHTDTTWPESPEHAWGELQGAECSDEEIHKITWENACRFFDWDPFKHTSPRITPPSARCGPGARPRSMSPACPEPSGRSRTRPLASASAEPRRHRRDCLARPELGRCAGSDRHPQRASRQRRGVHQRRAAATTTSAVWSRGASCSARPSWPPAGGPPAVAWSRRRWCSCGPATPTNPCTSVSRSSAPDGR